MFFEDMMRRSTTSGHFFAILGCIMHWKIFLVGA